MSFQRVIIEGLIGNIYDLKEYGEDGKAIDFSIATQEYDFKSKENRTVWHNLTAFGKNAIFIDEQLDKGSSVLVEGRLNYDSYDKDGVKHEKTKIIVDSIRFSGRKDKYKD